MAKPPRTPANSVLGIDSAWDSHTKNASRYREQHVYPYLEKQKFLVRRLLGRRAVRARVEEETKREGLLLITGVGHGTPTAFTGEKRLPVLEIGCYSPKEVAGKIIHLLSCEVADKLGPDLVKNGATAFFGYSSYFRFLVGKEEVFFACDAEIDLALADGLSAMEVHQRVVAVFEERIHLLSGVDQSGSDLLTADLDRLRTPGTNGKFGKGTARLTRLAE